MSDANGANRPTPDPTILTTEALARGLTSERDYVDGQLDVLRERLRAIDVATRLLNETVNRTPTVIQLEIAHLRELSDEQFKSVQTQFKERDTRQERESRDNKVAVDAAFAAQKEAAAKQDEANAKAIDKSEKATAETIKTNQELSKSTTDALTKSLDEIKLQVSRIETTKVAVSESKNDQRLNVGALIGVGGFLIAIASVVIAIMVATGH
jgi:cation transport regulator ChaB